jgi:hypothetical protein
MTMPMSLKEELKSLRRQIRRFAFLELALAITVLGVATSVAVPRYTGYVKRARAVEGVSRLRSIMTDSKMYFYKSGRWPGSPGELGYYADFTPTEHFRYRILFGGDIKGPFMILAEGLDVDGMKDISIRMSCDDVSSDNIVEIRQEDFLNLLQDKKKPSG